MGGHCGVPSLLNRSLIVLCLFSDRSHASPPLDSDTTAASLVASAVVRSSPKSHDQRRSRSLQRFEDFEPYPPAQVTQEERAAPAVATMTLPGDLQPEYRLIEKHNIVSVSGKVSWLHSGTSNKGPSEKRTTSQQRTLILDA